MGILDDHEHERRYGSGLWCICVCRNIDVHMDVDVMRKLEMHVEMGVSSDTESHMAKQHLIGRAKEEDTVQMHNQYGGTQRVHRCCVRLRPTCCGALQLCSCHLTILGRQLPPDHIRKAVAT